ncbi:MAG: DNA polymerase IV, partial [Actinobacteria bacterium]|nr:DNA polymerase IV [Actinomycetota bacterium]
ATLPYATTDPSTLTATARRLLLDPIEIGPIRLVGVGFSGLTDARQESLFPELEMMDGSDVATSAGQAGPVSAPPTESPWRVGDDVRHPDHGHGWVQGAGHGVMTVRFETRASGPGVARTVAADDPQITRADPIDSLDWQEYLAQLPTDDSVD